MATGTKRDTSRALELIQSAVYVSAGQTIVSPMYAMTAHQRDELEQILRHEDARTGRRDPSQRRKRAKKGTKSTAKKGAKRAKKAGARGR